MKTTRQVLNGCYCRLRPSKIHGVGVFAVRDIRKGVNPFKTVDKRYEYPECVHISPNELRDLPPKLAETLQAMFMLNDDGMFIPSFGISLVYMASVINHSAAPNLVTKDRFNFVSNQDIPEGTELTVDYQTFGAPLP